jgi:hypothetical protein
MWNVPTSLAAGSLLIWCTEDASFSSDAIRTIGASAKSGITFRAHPSCVGVRRIAADLTLVPIHIIEGSTIPKIRTVLQLKFSSKQIGSASNTIWATATAFCFHEGSQYLE